MQAPSARAHAETVTSAVAARRDFIGTPLGIVNIGVGVVIVRAAPLGCGGAWRGRASLLAAPAVSLVRCCCVPGVPVLGARRRAPNPRTRGWWRSLFGSLSDEAVAGFWGVCGVVLGGFVRRVAS